MHILLLLAVLLASRSYILVWIVRSYAVPAVAELLHAPDLQCAVRRVDITGLDLADVSLDGHSGPAIGSIRADWSLAGFVRGRISNLAINDLHLMLRQTDSGWEIPGLLIPQSGNEPGTGAATALPLIERIFVNGRAEIQTFDGTIILPLTVHGSVHRSDVALNATIHAAGQPLHINTDMNLQTGDLRAQLHLPTASVAALTSLVPQDIPPLSGLIRLLASGRITPTGESTVNASLDLNNARALLGPIPLQIRALSARTSLQDRTVTMPHLDAAVTTPIPVTLQVRNLQADLSSGRLSCAWNASMEHVPGYTTEKPLQLSGQTQLQLHSPGWETDTNATCTGFVLHDRDRHEVGAHNATLSLHTASSGRTLAVNGTVHIPEGHVFTAGRTAVLRDLSAQATASITAGQINARSQLRGGLLTIASPDLAASCAFFAATMTATNGTMHGQLTTGRLEANSDDIRAFLPELTARFDANMDAETFNGQYTLNFTGARLKQKETGLRTTQALVQGSFALAPRPYLNGEIHLKATGTAGTMTATTTLRLPVSWPEPAQNPGRLVIDAYRHKKRIAALAAALTPKGSGYTISGTTTLFPLSMRGTLTGQVDPFAPEQTVLSLSADHQLELPGTLPQFIPAARGTVGSGKLTLSGQLRMEHGYPVCPARIDLHDLSLSHEASTTRLSGGSLRLEFADLLTSRSQPEQELTFSRLELGSILIENGDIRFQIDAPQSILVEGCDFRWAGGRIGTQAFRINPEIQDYKVVLYCDRVEMARALEQLGLSQAQGGGRANGRIPVHYAQGSLTFDDGFLYSTPGEKGVLRVQGTEALTAGIPPDSPQYAQLDLAAEALKEFSYDWARIRLQTDQQDLVVSLEMDGKPVKALPFVYKRDFGGFARVDASSPGSVFQGIRLDANFRLPLDQLLQYRQLLQLMNNGG